MDDMVLTVKEVSKILKTNPAYIYELIKSGMLPALKLRSIRVSNDMFVSIKQFHERLKAIGITYQYISDETEEYCRLEETIKKNSEPNWNYRNQDKRR